MKTIIRGASCLAVLLSIAMTDGAPAADVVFENARLRAVLGDDACWRSLVDKATGKDYHPAGKRVSFAAARVAKKTRHANRASLEGDRLVVGFAGCDTQLTYQVAATDDWITWRLVEVSGTRPSRVTLVRLGVSITQRVGAKLGAAWNDHYAICLRAANLQTQGSCSRRGDYTQLIATTQDAPGPKLEGSSAVLVGAPTAELRFLLRRLSAACDLPRNEGAGVPSKDLPFARRSYWFLNFGEKDVARVIDYCRRTGFRQVMIGSSSWCDTVGHFTFNKRRYPDGLESLRRTVAELHKHGVLVGMHTFTSKVSKRDAYVTPVPDRRFLVDRTATLAADVGPEAATLRTADDLSQWPGSPVCKQKVWEGQVSKHREVIIDDEIICYESIGPEGVWNTFFGCRRGSWGTRAAGHKAQTLCRHYAVDGCINGYIIDQETSLLEETTDRLAHIFNTCDFDMVYFDGSEDVDWRRYAYYASRAHAVAMSKFTKRPLIHMGGGMTHGLWHSFTRWGTIDQYPATYLASLRAGSTIEKWPTCKEHIDRSVRRVIACEEEMIPGELGWFGIGPKEGDYDGLQFDEIEYLMCKSLAYDAPISLQTSFARMEAHLLTPDILEIVRIYERTRLRGMVPEAVRERLKRQGTDFMMLPESIAGEDYPTKFVTMEGLDKVAGTHDIRAWIGPHGRDTVATVWHYLGKEGKLLLDTREVAAYDVRGNTIQTQRTGDQVAVPIGARRTTLRFPKVDVVEARWLLTEAKLQLREPVVLWIQAEDYHQLVGNMATGSQLGVREAGAFGDVVLCGGRIDPTGKTPCYCEYRVQIPHKGRWTLWARVRYPTGDDMSFGVVLPGQEVTFFGKQVLGNCGLNNGQWHWTGRGSGVTTAPPGSPVVFNLEPGEFVFRIYPREGRGTARDNPRLDCLCLAEDPAFRPADDAVDWTAGSERAPQGDAQR